MHAKNAQGSICSYNTQQKKRTCAIWISLARARTLHYVITYIHYVKYIYTWRTCTHTHTHTHLENITHTYMHTKMHEHLSIPGTHALHHIQLTHATFPLCCRMRYTNLCCKTWYRNFTPTTDMHACMRACMHISCMHACIMHSCMYHAFMHISEKNTFLVLWIFLMHTHTHTHLET